MPRPHSIASTASSMQSIETVLIVSASKTAFKQLAALGQAEDLGKGTIRLEGFEPFDSARRQDQHAMRSLATQRLLPGEGHHIELGEIEVLGKGGRGGVADGQALRSAGIQSAFGPRTPEVVPFQVNTTSR
jgi:hypothetical protein